MRKTTLPAHTLCTGALLLAGALLLTAGCGSAQNRADKEPLTDVAKRNVTHGTPVTVASNTDADLGTGTTSKTAIQSVPPEKLHALLINGGARPDANNLSHVEHLRAMLEVLDGIDIPDDHITVFSSDGENVDRDMVRRAPDEEPLAWLLAGTELGKQLEPQPELDDTKWPDIDVAPATKDELERYFQKTEDTLQPGDTLLVYVTDHGLKGERDLDNGSIALWYEELYVDEMRDMLAEVPAGVRVVMVMSQCFSGTFAAAVLDEFTLQRHDELKADVCGVFSVPRDKPAYGCYPEGEAGGALGHGYVFIEALGQHGSVDMAHQASLLDDDAPDIPIRTSDVYVQQLLRDRGEKERIGYTRWVEQQVLSAWAESGPWIEERELIQQIAETYGMPTPTSLSEIDVLRQKLGEQRRAFLEAEKTWRSTASGVARANLVAFLDDNQQWRRKTKRLERLDSGQRAQLRSDVLAAMKDFAREREPLLNDLKWMSQRAEKADQGHWRSQVREAALDRMHILLLRMAALYALAEESGTQEKETLKALTSCEATAIAGRKAALSTNVKLPALAEESELVDTLKPTRLGIAYDPSSEVEGAVEVSKVAQDSAAERAGLQRGDVVVGPPGSPFEVPIDINRWVVTSPVGVPLELEIIRQGDPRRITVEL